MQRAHAGRLRVPRLMRVIRSFPPFVKNALSVTDKDIFLLQSHRDQQVQTGHRGGAGARTDQFHILDLFPAHPQSIANGRRHDNRRAVLVIVENRDIQALDQFPLNLETLGGLDVLQIDAAKGRRQGRYGIDKFVRIACIQFQIEDIDIRESLEQGRLAFHHGLGRMGSDVPQAEHRRTVGYHRHQIPARRVIPDGIDILDDRLADRRNPGGVSQRQIMLSQHALGRLDRDLSGNRLAMVIKGGILQISSHLVTRLFREYKRSFVDFPTGDRYAGGRQYIPESIRTPHDSG